MPWSREPSLLDIAERTKISPRYLRAIEEGRLHELPGGIYTASYIRQYLAARGGNPDAQLSRYLERCAPDRTTPAKRSVFNCILAKLLRVARYWNSV